MKPDPKQARGYRNRNPGNIEHNPRNKWLGLADPPSDGRFCRFTEHRYGIRALAILLMTYYDRHECDTVFKIISRFAPKAENPTNIYAPFVARQLRVTLDTPIDLRNPTVMFGLVKGIISFELGGMPYSDAELWEGLRLAGFQRPAPGGIVEATATDTGKGTVATAAAGIIAVLSQVTPLLDGLPWQVAVALIVVTGVAVLFWRAKRP